MKQHFFLNGAYLGSREIPTWTTLGGSEPPRVASSYLLICGKCGEIWGKMMHDHPEAFTQPVLSACREHALFPSDATFTVETDRYPNARHMGDCEGFPPGVLEHDVASLCNFYLNNPAKFYHE